MNILDTVPPLFALYKDGSVTQILAFDGMGYALVLSGRDGRLVRAVDTKGFKTCAIEEHEEFKTTPFGVE